jgi:hypothetical protein
MGGGEIRLVGLVKRFEDVAAVDGIDLDVPGAAHLPADALRILSDSDLPAPSSSPGDPA